jgi:hypothetical protein
MMPVRVAADAQPDRVPHRRLAHRRVCAPDLGAGAVLGELASAGGAVPRLPDLGEHAVGGCEGLGGLQQVPVLVAGPHDQRRVCVPDLVGDPNPVHPSVHPRLRYHEANKI